MTKGLCTPFSSRNAAFMESEYFVPSLNVWPTSIPRESANLPFRHLGQGSPCLISPSPRPSPLKGEGDGGKLFKCFSLFAPYPQASQETMSSSPVSAKTMNSWEKLPPIAP